MATFLYKAKKPNAETVSGQIFAHSHEEAIELINQLGLIPVNIVPKDDNSSSRFRSKGSVSGKDLYIFSRQLTNLLKSGVSLLRSLSIIEQQTQNLFLKKMIKDICSQIKNGRSLSQSLETFPEVFSPLYVTMIKAGEESGNLREMLENISSFQKSQDEIMSKVKTALTYPLFMAGVGIITVYFILTFVVPRMGALFANLKDALPLPTKMLLMTGQFLSRGWLWVLIFLAVLGLLAYQLGRSVKVRVALSRLLLSLPIFGEVLLKVDLARFCRTMVLLLKGGVPLIKAIKTTIPILVNEVIRKDFKQCEEDLTLGGSFGESIKKSSKIPPMMAHLISIGEESGNLNEVLSEIAQTYEQETSEKIKVMTTLLEPVMILLVGLAVGFIVFALLLPIFQLDIFGA
ncbi:MAG: type II secretion system F family protein [Candidatus Omnitrophica bacterium]|nr:type II secretion system F family protein [Candidatus Omnitrophota bacterium]